MHALKIKSGQQHAEPASATAIVISEQPAAFIVKTSNAQLVVKQAVSCLVRPAVGDTVLLFIDTNGQGYILSILERIREQSTRISVNNDLVIESGNDSITLAAKETINIASAKRANFTSAEVAISGRQGTVQFNSLDIVSDRATAHTGTSRLFSDTVETVAQTLTQRMQNCFRFVDKMDQLNAGNLVQSVRNLMSLKTRQAVVVAEQDVKIDGERIHMG